MTHRRSALAALLVLALLASAAVPAAGEAAAKRRADLRIVQLDLPATAPSAGAIVVRAKVANTGRRARASVLRLLLSRDGRADPRDAVLGRRAIPGLKPGKAAAHRASVKLPAVTGAWRLIACADATRKVRERNERNNCRARGVTLAKDPDGPPTPEEPAVTGPFDVTTNADPSRAATRVVGPSGATLSAAGADGTVYTLALPKDAVLGDTEITMTPLASVEGHPLDRGFAGGVQLGPEGLQLRLPATLTVQPPQPLAPEQVTALGYEGTGNDLHLFPGLVDGTAIKLYVSHFSGVVVGLASLTRQEELAKARVESAQAGYERDAAAIINEGRREGRGFDDPALRSSLVATFKAQYNNLIGPELDAAQTDDSKFYSSLRALIAWDRTVGLLGLTSCGFLSSSGCGTSDPFRPEFVHAGERWRKVVRNAYVKAYQRCRDEFDPRYANRILAITREAALLGLEIGDLGDTAACLKFELQIDTTVTREERADGAAVGSATAHVELPAMKIRFQPGSGFFGDRHVAGARLLALARRDERLLLRVDRCVRRRRRRAAAPARAAARPAWGRDPEPSRPDDPLQRVRDARHHRT